MLAELVDAVVGVDTHRDTHEAEIALPSGAPIRTLKINKEVIGKRRKTRRSTGIDYSSL